MSPLSIGSHTSAAGGVHKAALEAGRLGMSTFQLFTKNNNQWKGKPIADVDVVQFKEAILKFKLQSSIAHTSYLINLGSPNPELHAKSIAALVDEWERAELLCLNGLVMHPGSATDKDEQAGLRRIVDGINQATDQVNPSICKLLLENTAGQGTAIGWKMEHLHSIITSLDKPNDLGICIDSCHAHAAGYDLSSSEGLDRLTTELRQMKIDKNVIAIHLNDSLKPAGSRVDRHAHLGHGTIGEEGLQKFINHPTFCNLPMVLETEKGEDDSGVEWDVVNMETARRLRATADSFI